MSSRTKLMGMFTLTVLFAVGSVGWAVSAAMRQVFKRLDEQRTAALVAQFRREFHRRGEEVTRRAGGIADSEAALRIAVALSGSSPDYSPYVNEAANLATAHQLDFLELVASDGTIVSSAQWPARFGYKEPWVTEPVDWAAQTSFLKREELADGVALSLAAVRPVKARDKKLYIVGGQRLDKEFLASLVLPEGIRALLYTRAGENSSATSITEASGPVAGIQKLMPLISEVEREPRELAQTVKWSDDDANSETFHAIPLTGRNREILGMFLVGSSRREQVALEKQIRNTALLIAGVAVAVGLVFSGWAAARTAKPVEQLAAAAREVARGNWNARVEVQSGDELGQLSRAFNQMTQQLLEQRDRLVQAERVAAWRELARRLAHELKNPLFPLQITVENLLRARELRPEQFDEVFRESTSTLLAELTNLKTIVGRFSDFARMPAPRLQPVHINDVIRGALKLFEAQLHVSNTHSIVVNLQLAEGLAPIQADPELLHRAAQNLIMNALDAMPSGGTLTVRTCESAEGVHWEVSDTGKGLTREECERLFTPYYTTKQHGTGLGLAIVQSVVSDHGGKISVESEPEHGTTFKISLPAQPPSPAQIDEQSSAASTTA